MELRDGRFWHDGEPFAPIGFNYWPSRSGVHCWKRFDLAEWEEDFRAIRARGFNTLRMFLLWEDFQPAEDCVNERALEQLARVAQLAAQYDLWLMPTLFQGWMSGTNFDPPWRAGRNHIRDMGMRRAMVLLARRVAEALREADHIIAIDLANEIRVICPDVDGASVAAWTGELATAIQAARPGTLVTNGVDDGPMHAASKWDYASQRVDFTAMHGYPVFWTPLPIGRLGACRSSIIFGYMTAFAAAYKPVMRQEFGLAMGGDSALMGGFVRASSAASYLAGANGYLYWCWRDIASDRAPYDKDPFESSLGYVDAALNPKAWSAGYDAFRDFYLAHAAYAPVRGDAAIYIPTNHKSGGEEADRSLASAYENLVANGLTPAMTAEISSSFRLIIVPHSRLRLEEIRAAEDYVRQGGRLIVVNPSFFTCGRYWEALTETRQVDLWRPLRPVRVELGGHALVLPPVGERQLLPVLAPLSANACVEARHEDVPIVLTTQRGQGVVVQCALPLHAVGGGDYSAALMGVWGYLLRAAGYEAPFHVSQPCVQVGELRDSAGANKLLVINHQNAPLEVCVEGRGRTYRLVLGAKDFAVCD